MPPPFFDRMILILTESADEDTAPLPACWSSRCSPSVFFYPMMFDISQQSFWTMRHFAAIARYNIPADVQPTVYLRNCGRERIGGQLGLIWMQFPGCPHNICTFSNLKSRQLTHKSGKSFPFIITDIGMDDMAYSTWGD